MAKVTQHTPCKCSLFIHHSCDSNKNKRSFHRVADYMKRFCANLRYATKVTDCEEKEMMPLTKNKKRNTKN